MCALAARLCGSGEPKYHASSAKPAAAIAIATKRSRQRVHNAINVAVTSPSGRISASAPSAMPVARPRVSARAAESRMSVTIMLFSIPEIETPVKAIHAANTKAKHHADARVTWRDSSEAAITSVTMSPINVDTRDHVTGSRVSA